VSRTHSATASETTSKAPVDHRRITPGNTSNELRNRPSRTACGRDLIQPVTRLSQQFLTTLATIALLVGLAGAVPAGAATQATAPAARADCSAQLAAADQAAAFLEKKFDKYTKANHNLNEAKAILAMARSPQDEAKAAKAVKKAEKKYKKALKKFQAAQDASEAADQAYQTCLAQP